LGGSGGYVAGGIKMMFGQPQSLEVISERHTYMSLTGGGGIGK